MKRKRGQKNTTPSGHLQRACSPMKKNSLSEAVDLNKDIISVVVRGTQREKKKGKMLKIQFSASSYRFIAF